MKYCINCGKKIGEKDKFCEKCSSKIVGFSTISKSVPPVISEKRKIEEQKQNKKPFYKKWWFITIIALWVWYLLTADTAQYESNSTPPVQPLTQPITSTSTQTPPISNPDYLKNPSAYLVDKEYKVSSSAVGKTLWVEEIVDSHTLKVSYIEEKAGTKILVVKDVVIPWLIDPSEDRFISKNMISIVFSPTVKQCWENGTKEFLKTHFLHSKVYLYSADWYPDGRLLKKDVLLSFTDGTVGDREEGLLYFDFSTYVIMNGYGGVGPTQLYSTSPLELKYHTELTDNQGVASLAKRGLWGTCQ